MVAHLKFGKWRPREMDSSFRRRGSLGHMSVHRLPSSELVEQPSAERNSERKCAKRMVAHLKTGKWRPRVMDSSFRRRGSLGHMLVHRLPSSELVEQLSAERNSERKCAKCMVAHLKAGKWRPRVMDSSFRRRGSLGHMLVHRLPSSKLAEQLSA